MFEKLLSLLPYNPSLAHQLAFYSRRMREEAAIRRIGLGFILLAFFIQFFAVFSPPQPTVADSSNDLINGGISSKSQAVSVCKANTRHYKDITSYYGISCADISGASTVTLKSTAHDKKLYSAGFNAQGAHNNKTGKPTGEVTANKIPHTKNVYWRYLWSWDSGSSSSYKALKLKSAKTGKTYYILYSCGNLVSIGVPVPPPAPKPTPKPQPKPQPKPVPKPKPCQYNSSLPADSPDCKPCTASSNSADSLACVQFSKTATNQTQQIADANDTMAKAGDVILYTLYAKNTGKGTVKAFVMQENLNDVLDYADVTDWHGGTFDKANGIVSWPAKDIAAGATLSNQITVKVKNPIPQTPASTSDPAHFDLVMTNVYGNAINIKLPGGTIKVIEAQTTSLPNTGPGTSLAIAAAIVVFAGYFYGRSRLLAKESILAIQETNGA